MSNVLIGIIGVILFIGLALAGALILGDDFTSSRSASAGAATVAQLQQVASAINMHRLKTGAPLLASNNATNMAALAPRFLRAVPVNPFGAPFVTVDQNGFGTATPVHHVYTRVGDLADPAAKAVCRAIEEQMGSADPDAAIAPITTSAGWAPRIASSKGAGCLQFTPPTPGFYAFIVV